MATHDPKYTVQTRLAMLENFATEIRKEISAIQLKEGKPGARGCDGARGLTGEPGRNGTDGKPGKDAVGIRGADGIQGPRGIRGERGRTPRFKIGEVQTLEAGQSARAWLTGTDDDPILNFAVPVGVGAQGTQGIQGERGDITVYGDAELQAAVIALRRKLLEQRAAFLAVINQRIAENSNTNSKVQNHFARLLEYVKRDIESL
jgi:hypothetical protein